MQRGRVYAGITAIMVCLIPLLLEAQYQVVEPEPFRRDEIEGRDFEYNDQSFIDRFTYQFDSQQVQNWNRLGEGFRITAGSVSNDEAYVVAQLKKRWFFEEWLFGTIRYRRDEDFDSRYDRTLFGVGTQFLDKWSFTLLGEVQAEKEDIDLHFELAWEENPNIQYFPSSIHSSNENSRRIPSQDIGSRARFALVLADQFFNGKSDDGFYREKPMTFFGEGALVWGQGYNLYAWVNYNPELELELNEDDSLYQYEQLRGGVETTLPLLDRLSMFLSVKGERGDRSRTGGAGFVGESDFSRESVIGDAEIRWQSLPEFQSWVGFRYFALDERDIRRDDAANDRDLERQEWMVHSGIRWKINERVTFRPALYLNDIDNQEDFFGDQERSSRDDRVTGRVTLPVEVNFKYQNAVAVINPTLEWPGDPFGGLNVQVQFPF